LFAWLTVVPNSVLLCNGGLFMTRLSRSESAEKNGLLAVPSRASCPDAIDLGAIAALTGANGGEVRDNPGSANPKYTSNQNPVAIKIPVDE
jgi:hypothetical protein